MRTVFQFARFICVGVTGLLVLLATTYVLTEIFYFWYFWSYVAATFLSWTCIFVLNSFFTFAGHDKGHLFGKYFAFLSMYASVFTVNAGIVYTLTSWAGVQYLLSIVVASAITTTLTFTMSRKHIFRYEDTHPSV